jgi:hypothetical protein
MVHTIASRICGFKVKNGAVVKLNKHKIELGRQYALVGPGEENPNSFLFTDGSWFYPYLVD